ncbi:MAG: hypothetical protein ACK55Z_37670, partial [bacterium]
MGGWLVAAIQELMHGNHRLLVRLEGLTAVFSPEVRHGLLAAVAERDAGVDLQLSTLCQTHSGNPILQH